MQAVSSDELRIRDKRRRNWFSIDNEIIREYGPEIEGSRGIAVYATLACYAFDEVARVSITTICKLLKMGRAKLLSILTLLEEKGLIEIEVGDRQRCNTYTLLEVPKKDRGSTQNHETGDSGSTQNHTSAVGGSPQNSNNIREGNKIKDSKIKDCSVKEEELVELDTLLEEDNVLDFPPRHGRTHKEFEDLLTVQPIVPSKEAVEAIRSISAWPKSFTDTVEIIAKLTAEHPNVDPVKICRDFAYYCEYSDTKITSYPLKLRTFFRNEDRWAKERKAKGKANSKSVDDSDGFWESLVW